MKKTRGGKTFDTSQSCADYRESLKSEVCEVTYLLPRDALSWMSGHLVPDSMHIHHIHGRPLPVERGYFANLIQVSPAAHSWCHDVNPAGFELACWLVKVRTHAEGVEWWRVSGQVEPPIERLNFHLPSLNRIVWPMASFAGRVSYLREKVLGTVFAGYADEILTFVEGL